MPEYKCEICGKVCQNPQALKMHLRTHEKEERPTLPPDEGKEKDSPENLTSKEGKKQPISIPKLSSLGPILQAFGITDGASLVKAIDDKARQMPFYSEIINEMNQMKKQVEELNGIITETSQKIDNLIKQLQQAQAQVSGGNGTKEIKTQVQPQLAQPATTQKAGSLEGWADRLLELLKIGAVSGNPNSAPSVERKYEDLIALANVLKTIQGDPMKQLTDSFKVFSDIQKNAISIAKGVSSQSTRTEMPRPKTGGLEK